MEPSNTTTKAKKKRKRRAPENSADAAAARVVAAVKELNEAIEEAVALWRLDVQISVDTLIRAADDKRPDHQAVSVDRLTKDFMPF